MWAALPLMALPVAAYNALVGLGVQGRLRGDAAPTMARPILTITMASHGAWSIGLGDVFVSAALIILFVELIKSTGRRDIAIINHSLSMLLFIVCLVEFLLFRAFATSAFFLISAMVALDVLAGFIVTIAATRREIGGR